MKTQLFLLLSAFVAVTTSQAEPNETAESVYAKELSLVKFDGKKVSKHEQKAEPQYYAFYYSAHWCGPCRAFTPKLVSFYNENQRNDGSFEVIFVSSDRDEKSMEGYMEEANMPWPAISYKKVKSAKKVLKHKGRGIPCLVLVDREGNVIKDSYEGNKYVGPGVVMQELKKLLDADQS